MLNSYIFKAIDNSSLIVFRIIFGGLIFLESIGAIFTGWIKTTLIDPKFTFSFIGFEWLQPLPGNWMYVYYVVMGLFGFCVMLGYKYRLSIIVFTLMWTATYLMQKSSYNNHYYLLILVCLIMCIQPAHRYFSLDVIKNPSIKRIAMPQWCRLVFVLQMGIVYTYGAIAKLYPDWLDTTVIEILMKSKQHYYIIGDLLQQKEVHYFLAYGGIFFDGLIIPLLLYKRTRKWAFIASLFFHLFNSIVFQIGIFPFLSLAFILFFFEAKTIHALFLKKKEFYHSVTEQFPKYRNYWMGVLLLFFVIQIALPLRHWFINDNVLWTEEGHRMSWRMMLRTKSGYSKFKVVNKDNSEDSINIKLQDYLTTKQQRTMCSKPDMIWQFAQHLKQDFKAQGKEVSIYVNCKVSINGHPSKRLIDPSVDLANTNWNTFKHSEWLLPSCKSELK